LYPNLYTLYSFPDLEFSSQAAVEISRIQNFIPRFGMPFEIFVFNEIILK
jgi:hypothetical protein